VVGTVAALPRAFSNAVRALTTGVPAADVTSFDRPAIREFSGGGANPFNWPKRALESVDDFFSTVAALFSAIGSGELPRAAGFTIKLLLKGYVAGVVLAALFTAFATYTRLGADLLEILTGMFNPLPSIALLPLALIWFGLGDGSVIFVLIHAVLWVVALNTFAGFRAISPTLRMVGRNYGLSNLGYTTRILIPGAFPSILTGLKVGWAFAWRTLIAAELVFGVSSGSGGLGWYIFEHKNQLLIPQVFAGLLTVILFGLFVENLIFKVIENRTVRRWGMQS